MAGNIGAPYTMDGGQRSGGQAEQRGFSGAVLAQDRHAVNGSKAEVDAVKDVTVAEAHADAAQFKAEGLGSVECFCRQGGSHGVFSILTSTA
ncbi:hypothetical protein AUR04nite_24880 [Glutamicibacter uratoxydans]|uniref:Uncharacterized protein n=1 Tax=Glutamicibacter uratoxydans TaxID=43667 RepID=A0A4Y4DPV9_GLUUR|nr:hypothetical protein AUR04nite_24880 [Glutamicibacter uratoxydans]